MSLQDRFKYDKVGILIGFCIMFMILTFAYSRIIPFEIKESPTGIIETKVGNDITICRWVDYKRETSLNMNRAITKNKEDGTMLTINYPEISFIRDVGQTYICRTLTLPKYLEEGRWTIQTYLTVHSFPFWKNTFEIAKIDLNIRD